MAGNFKSNKKLDVKWASMSLHWNNPIGDRFEPWLGAVKSVGYDGVSCFAEIVTDPFCDKASSLNQALKNTGTELASIAIQLNDTEEMFERTMNLMNETGCENLICIAHGANDKTPELYKHYAGLFNNIAEKSFARGICSHLHNNSDSIVRNFTDWSRMMPLIDWNKAFFMADTGHATKDFDEKPHSECAVSFLDEHWDKLHYLEFKDFNEVTDLDTPLGEGFCDYPGIFDIMKERGYTGWITIEQNQNSGLSLGRSPEECARISREFVRSGLGV